MTERRGQGGREMREGERGGREIMRERERVRDKVKYHTQNSRTYH
jgi:hypothetical protein